MFLRVVKFPYKSSSGVYAAEINGIGANTFIYDRGEHSRLNLLTSFPHRSWITGSIIKQKWLHIGS